MEKPCTMVLAPKLLPSHSFWNIVVDLFLGALSTLLMPQAMLQLLLRSDFCFVEAVRLLFLEKRWQSGGDVPTLCLQALKGVYVCGV